MFQSKELKQILKEVVYGNLKWETYSTTLRRNAKSMIVGQELEVKEAGGRLSVSQKPLEWDRVLRWI